MTVIGSPVLSCFFLALRMDDPGVERVEGYRLRRLR